MVSLPEAWLHKTRPRGSMIDRERYKRVGSRKIWQRANRELSKAERTFTRRDDYAQIMSYTQRQRDGRKNETKLSNDSSAATYRVSMARSRALAAIVTTVKSREDAEAKTIDFQLERRDYFVPASSLSLARARAR